MFQKHALTACVKAGLELQGFDVGDPIPPQRPLGPEAREDIRLALAAAEGASTAEAPHARDTGPRRRE